MGCSSSRPPPEDLEGRKGIPLRIEIPVGAGFMACRVGKKLEGDNEFELLVDNGGPMIQAVLKRPAASATFEDFTEANEDAGEDADEDYNAFVMRLPVKIGQGIDIIHDGKREEGRLSNIPRYAPEERLVLVTRDNSVVDATVVECIGKGSRHKVAIQGGGTTIVDLNEFNHAPQHFESVAEYASTRVAYLEQIIDKLSLIEDAITGNRLNCDDQLIYITVLTDKKSEGTAWANISSMEDLTGHLVAPSPLRSQGTHDAQGVLVRAGPGTGKTVSLQQLTRLVAKSLHASAATDVGLGVVPLFLQVQRLASYLKKGTLNLESNDLLSAFIGVEYSGKTKDLLLQAYASRALVVAIDGVDEAAGLKSRIEDLITDKLSPMGIRVVASSRPEGVRLERYQKFVTMDLAPLSDEQQNQAVAFQLKNSVEYDHLVVLGKIQKEARATGKEPADEMKAKGGASYERIFNNVVEFAGEANAPSAFVKTMEFFELASSVPVMLSMYVLCLEDMANKGSGRLPTSRLDLYISAVRAAVNRRFPQSTDSPSYNTAGLMLAKIAVENHLAQRREFTSLDVKTVLADSPDALAMWLQLEAEADGVPLIKVLEVGANAAEASAESDGPLTKYQFKHLSFQESFFAEGLCWTPDNPSDALMPDFLALLAQSVWHKGALKVLNDRWMLNSFAICGTALGSAVSEKLGKDLLELKVTEHQVKVLIALGWEPLRGQNALKLLVLPIGSGITFTTKASLGVSSLAALLADRTEVPGLEKLDFGLPARIGVEAAATIAAAAVPRKGLRLCGPVYPAQFCCLSEVDAVLVTATLGSCCSGSFDASYISTVQLMHAGSDAARICMVASPDATLASFLKSAGTSASAFPKDLANHLVLAGFDAADMRAAKYTTAELIDMGYPAKDILASLCDGTPTPAALTECAEAGLALELVAGPGANVTLEQLREAEIKIPSDDDMLETVQRITNLGSFENLKKLPNIMCARESIYDRDGDSLIWAFAIHCSDALIDINFTRNQLGEKTCMVLMQYLRFNRTITSLDMNDNVIDNAGLAYLARMLSFNSKLTLMRVSNNEDISIDGIPALYDGIMKNLTLEGLVMETSAGVMTTGVPIPQLKGQKPKELIDLASRRFGPMSAAIIAKLISECRPTLFELGIDRNPLKAEGMKYIAEMLKQNDDIREIDLRFCSMHKEGAKYLSEALKVNTSVEHALLLANQMGAEGAAAIIDMLPHNKSLKLIGMQDNLLNDDSKNALREAALKYGIRIDV
mmetsp:Transcript_13926/g.35924  ORF Transcript_13926/g.35924 Transcript_13926/m.35924 type:complete len:1262 (+) Transcript_13926:78-3863(+)